MVRPVDHELVRRNLSLIKLVRGRPMLEALHFLQHGRCAYDGQPCALLLPHVFEIAPSIKISKEQVKRFATIDHVLPRALGGTSDCDNVVMASQKKNSEKGCLAPEDEWAPLLTHCDQAVKKALSIVEQRRSFEALRLADERDLSRRGVVKKLILRELRRLTAPANFKFYESSYPAVL